MTGLMFNYDEIKERYETFVSKFLSGDTGVTRKEVFPKVWMVSIPKKDFSVMITCESRLNGYGFDEWYAVVEEPNGEKSNFLLFEGEIENWLAEQRRMRGVAK